MKHLNLLGLFLLLTIVSKAQSGPCLCGTIGQGAHFAPDPVTSEPKAQSAVNAYTRLFLNHPIITAKVSSSVCEPIACAVICPPYEQKYIFYNPDFFRKLQTNKASWGDQFVLAHEIAHHVLGHTTWLYYSSKAQWQRLNGNSPPASSTSSQKTSTARKKYLADIPRLHLQELEADAVGLMLLQRQKVTRPDLEQMFTILPEILAVADVNSGGLTHPSWNLRRQLILDQWDKSLAKPRKPSHAGKPSVAMETQPATIDDLSDDELIDIESIGHKTEAAYAFYLLNADKTQTGNLNETELSIRDSLNRESRFSIEPILGVQFQQPVFSRNNKPVLATANRNVYAGIRVGVGAWYHPHRLETDLLYNVNAFDTNDSFGNQVLTVEHFQMQWLSLRPRYVFSYLLHRSPYRYRTHGLMLTGGASVRAPLGFTYRNSTVASSQAPGLQISANWIAGVGYSLSNWRNNGQIRVYLLYEPQLIRFQTTAPDPVQATLRTFSIECSFRFWKL